VPDIEEGARRLARAVEKARENGSGDADWMEGQEPIV
jgi:hypothetical protein